MTEKTATPAPANLTADEWTAAFSRRTVGGNWAGGDVNVSVTSRSGDVWWFYGDSFTENKRGWFKDHTSTALVFPRGQNTALQPRYLGLDRKTTPTLLPSSRDEKYWPSAAVTDPSRTNHHILSASHISIHGPGMWDFAMTGSTLFGLSLRTKGRPVVRVTSQVATPQPSGGNAIQWGSAMVISDDSLYLYGSREVAGALGKDIYLAAAPLKEYHNTDLWLFLQPDGSMSTNVDTAVPVFTADQGLPHTFSVTPHPEAPGLLLVAKRDEGAGQHVVAAASPTPYGPWGSATPILDAAPRNGIVQYMAIAHPHVPLGDGGLLVTTSQNVVSSDALERLSLNPTLYRPQFYRVPYSNLPSLGTSPS